MEVGASMGHQDLDRALELLVIVQTLLLEVVRLGVIQDAQICIDVNVFISTGADVASGTGAIGFTTRDTCLAATSRTKSSLSSPL